MSEIHVEKNNNPPFDIRIEVGLINDTTTMC